jgi:DNA-binding beta-propeller fold protein YncE
MNRIRSLVLFLVVAGFASCVNDSEPVPALDPYTDSGYPDSIAQIMVGKCATSGCHNSASASSASGLELTSWNKMFEGNRSGSVVVPFSPQQSSLFVICNTFADLGVQLTPTMPVNAPPLSRAEVETLKNWIAKGAPDKNNLVPFSNLYNKKTYITNQGCDYVAVFSTDKKVITRYVKVGSNFANTEAPHNVRLTPDNKYWFVVLYASNVLQKYDSNTDTLVGTCTLPSFGGWSVVHFTPDSKTAIVSDLQGGAIQMVNVDDMSLIGPYYNVFPNAHGLFIHPVTGKFYVTNQYSNYIYKMDLSDPAGTSENISLAADKSIIDGNSLNPHEIAFTPDGSKYFVTCDYSNEVRVMDGNADTLIAVIPVPNKPLEIFCSKNYPYMIFSCHDYPSPFVGSKGAVTLIDYNTLQVAKIFDKGFYEPHGIAIDDDKDLVYVISRNISASGPAPHHISECGARNGFLSIIDLKALTVQNFKHELSVDPYSAAYKH